MGFYILVVGRLDGRKTGGCPASIVQIFMCGVEMELKMMGDGDGDVHDEGGCGCGVPERYFVV